MSAGIRAGDPQALVIGGVTAPSGANDDFRTAPQTFASELKSLGAAAYFDVYSTTRTASAAEPISTPACPR